MARQGMYDRVASYGATYDNQAYDQKKKAPAPQAGGYNPQSAANAAGGPPAYAPPAGAAVAGPGAGTSQHRNLAGAAAGGFGGGVIGFFTGGPMGALKGASTGAALGDAATGGGVFTPSSKPPAPPEPKFTIRGLQVNAAQREQLRKQAEYALGFAGSTPEQLAEAKSVMSEINGPTPAAGGAPAGGAPAGAAPGVVPAPQNAGALANAAADEYLAQLAGKTTLADQAYIDRARSQAEVQKQQAAHGLGARGQGGNPALLTYANTQIDRGTNEAVAGGLATSRQAARDNAAKAYGQLMEPTLQSQQLGNQAQQNANQVYGAQLNYTLAATQAQVKQNLDVLDQMLKLGQIGIADYQKKKDDELATLNAATERELGNTQLPGTGYGGLADPLAGSGGGYGQAGYALPGRR